MSRAAQTAVAVRILGPTGTRRLSQPGDLQSDIPARSRLYGPAPCEVGTVWVESLSSYLHRLAARYCVAPRVFITEAILPYLSSWHETRPSLDTNRGGSYRREAMTINGAGDQANAWSELLCQLTGRADLREATLHFWASSLPTRGLLRWTPAWCPACYTIWQEAGQTLYHPLLWTLQVVTVCPRHQCMLVERCPHCQQRQSVIATRTQPGYCTQCPRWLGMPPSQEQPITDEVFSWQTWVVSCIEELYLGRRAFGSLPWATIPESLMVCREAIGHARALCALTNLPYPLFWHWVHGRQTPSFKRLLEFGYTLDETPLQLMASTADALKAWISAQNPSRPAHTRADTLSPINWEQIEQHLQEMLSGRERASGVSPVARQLGISAKYLRKKFPQECASITAQYQKDRATRAQQRVARQCLEVRQATLTLHEQGIKPTKQRVQALLSDAHILRRPECRATWHAARRELGLEQ